MYWKLWKLGTDKIKFNINQRRNLRICENKTMLKVRKSRLIKTEF